MARSEREKQWRREYRERAKALGMCTQCCVLPRVEGRAYCERCLKGQARRQNDRRDAARTEKRCPCCFKAHDGWRKLCAECRNAEGVLRRQRKADGLCVQCGKDEPEIGRVTCAACAEAVLRKDRALKKKRRAAKICAYCQTPCVDDQRVCETCTLKACASATFKSRKRWIELKAVFDAQDGRCALTGVKLVIRQARKGNQRNTASLDHKVPRSRGGTNDIENLQWVSWLANRAKTNMDSEEFLDFCLTVVLWEMRKRGDDSIHFENLKEWIEAEVEEENDQLENQWERKK